jgi:hypothetical protein
MRGVGTLSIWKRLCAKLRCMLRTSSRVAIANAWWTGDLEVQT